MHTRAYAWRIICRTPYHIPTHRCRASRKCAHTHTRIYIHSLQIMALPICKPQFTNCFSISQYIATIDGHIHSERLMRAKRHCLSLSPGIYICTSPAHTRQIHRLSTINSKRLTHQTCAPTNTFAPWIKCFLFFFNVIKKYF